MTGPPARMKGRRSSTSRAVFMVYAAQGEVSDNNFLISFFFLYGGG